MVATKLATTTIRNGLSEQPSLDGKLRFACEPWGAEGFELIRANPDAKDVFDLSFAPVRQGYARLRATARRTAQKAAEQGET
jgi:hypothetical protein